MTIYVSFKSCSLFTHQEEEEEEEDLIELLKFFPKTQDRCLTLSIWMLWPFKDQFFYIKFFYVLKGFLPWFWNL
jgi:hypothetical protein